MGLDMYLQKETYIGAMWEHREITGQVILKEKGVKIPIQFKRILYITEEVAYWRKSNAIHKWFVDNVQDGNDDCGKYRVSIEQLRKLAGLCAIVVAAHDKDGSNDKAEELLPTQAGFFFGATDYETYYYDDLRNTIDMIEDAIKGVSEDSYNVRFYYESSW